MCLGVVQSSIEVSMRYEGEKEMGGRAREEEGGGEMSL